MAAASAWVFAVRFKELRGAVQRRHSPNGRGPRHRGRSRAAACASTSSSQSLRCRRAVCV